jgi:hypothetical protein
MLNVLFGSATIIQDYHGVEFMLINGVLIGKQKCFEAFWKLIFWIECELNNVKIWCCRLD